MLKPYWEQSQPRSVTVKSPALEPGRPMPRQYTADGQNISPPLTWMDVPTTARQLVVTCQDDDEVVPLPLGRSVARLLDRRGVPVTFVEQPVGHTLEPFAPDIRAWIADAPGAPSP